MNDTLDTLLAKIRDLEREILDEGKRKEKQFCYSIHEKRVEFTEEATTTQRRFGSESQATSSNPGFWCCPLPR